MSEIKYFEKPTQVVFWDTDGGDHWIGGIAYRNEVICGCCGGVIEISEIYEFAPPTVGCPIREYDEWCSIDDAIIGVAYIVCDKKAPIAIVKHEVQKIITPAENQTADAYRINVRVYHTLEIKDNEYPAVVVMKNA